MSDAAQTAELDAFREETRAWLEENCPASMRTPMPEEETVWGGRNAQFPNPDSKLWLERMASKGWTAPTWPKAYGGGGLSADENKVLQQELGRIQARPALNSFGIWMLGPALLEFANEQQKQQFLPPIVAAPRGGAKPRPQHRGMVRGELVESAIPRDLVTFHDGDRSAQLS